MLQGLGPVDSWRVGVEIEGFRGSDECLLRHTRWEGGSSVLGLKPIVIEPTDKEHLHRAAAVHIALFVVRSDAADTGAIAFRDNSGKRLVAARGNGELPFGSRGTA